MPSNNDVAGSYLSHPTFSLRWMRGSLAALVFSLAAITAVHPVQLMAANSSTAVDLQVLSTSIASDSSGNIYYADTAHSIIYEVSTAGVATQVHCCTGLTVNSLNRPRGVALDSSGNLYIADTGNNRIVEISTTSQISVVNTQLYGLSNPSGIAVDAGADLYIADTGNNRILEVSGGGETALVSTGTYRLAEPLSVSIDGNNTLYITDTGNNRVVMIPASGAPSVLFANQLNAPLSITSGANGCAYVAETGSAVGSSTATGAGSGEMPALFTSFSATNMNIDRGAGVQGSIATANITLTPSGGFNNTLYLSVLGLPPGTEMQLSHPIVTLNGSSAVTEVLNVGISQSDQSAYLLSSGHHAGGFRSLGRTIAFAGIAPISLLMLFGIGASRKRCGIAKKITGLIVLFLLLPAALVATSGCAGGYPAGLFGSETYTATLVARTANGMAVYPLGSFGITMQ